MSLDQERSVGTRGLNLGGDPAQLAEGALVLADGVRFLEAGAAHSRNGRVRMGLEFPDEGVGTAATYAETITHLVGPGRVRGMAPFYDQRIETRLTTPQPDLPQRLNILYKSAGRIYMNEDFVGSGSGLLEGEGVFNNINSRAKFVVHEDRAYVIDESTDPKILQRRPKSEQLALGRIKYDIRRCGIQWPTDNAHKPTATPVVDATYPVMATGVYRFRIILENKNGTQSNASMPHTVAHSNPSATIYILVDWTGIIPSFPGGANAISKVRVYAQFQASGTQALEPSAYVLIKSVIPTYRENPPNTDPLGSIRFTATDHASISAHPLMPISNGATPRLSDMAIINDVAYGFSTECEIYRETPLSEGDNLIGSYGPTIYYEQITPSLRVVRNRNDAFKLYDNTTIKTVRVNRNCLFWGRPEAMENWVPVGSNSEIGIGVAGIGGTCVAFTNQAIYTFNGEELRRVYSKVGCLSRDSIVETEQGIRFLGSDGIPRIFNGAAVDEISSELLPIFDREDYIGDYSRFDKANAQECQGTFGDRKFYFTFPVTNSVPGYSKPGTYIDQSLLRNLAIGDASRGPTAWTIDRQGSYELIYWLGRESRLLGIETTGAFFFIEEGFVDQQYGIADEPIVYDVKFRKFSSAGGTQGKFYKLAIDANANGETLTLEARCDELVFTTTFTADRREEFKTYLPATFRGPHLDVRVFGNVESRVAIYGVVVDSDAEEVF